MHAERLRQGNHLVQRRIGQFTHPDLLDVFFGQISQAHPGYLGVGIWSPRSLVLYGVEELVGLFGDAQVPRYGFDGCPVPRPVLSSNHNSGGKSMTLAMAFNFSKPGFSILPFRKLVM